MEMSGQPHAPKATWIRTISWWNGTHLTPPCGAAFIYPVVITGPVVLPRLNVQRPWSSVLHTVTSISFKTLHSLTLTSLLQLSYILQGRDGNIAGYGMYPAAVCVSSVLLFTPPFTKITYCTNEFMSLDRDSMCGAGSDFPLRHHVTTSLPSHGHLRHSHHYPPYSQICGAC